MINEKQMSQSNEELMRRRYKVIAQYPFSAHPTGEIIKATTSGTYFDQYPHLFKKLEWWEDRKLEEMPEYLTCQSPDFVFKKGDVIKVDKWLESFGPTLRFYSSHTNKITLHPHLYTPATISEYEQYLNQQKQNNGTEK